MKIVSATIGKELLTNLGNFSNLKVSHYVTVEFAEGEEPNWDEIYDEINWNMQLESDNTDAAWIKREKFKEHDRLTIKFKRR